MYILTFQISISSNFISLQTESRASRRVDILIAISNFEQIQVKDNFQNKKKIHFVIIFASYWSIYIKITVNYIQRNALCVFFEWELSSLIKIKLYNCRSFCLIWLMSVASAIMLSCLYFFWSLFGCVGGAKNSRYFNTNFCISKLKINY